MTTSESMWSGTLGAAMTQAAIWAEDLRAIGGPDLLANAHLKAAHEAQELADNPVLEEFADVLICLANSAWHHGYSVTDLGRAVDAKTAVNRARKWRQEPDGTWQHVAAGETA